MLLGGGKPQAGLTLEDVQTVPTIPWIFRDNLIAYIYAQPFLCKHFLQNISV